MQVFEAALRLLSPFMPFITEELWSAVYNGKPPAKSIALTRYPQPGYRREAWDTHAQVEMQFVQELIVEIRALRKEIGVEEKAVVPAEVRAHASLQDLVEGNRDIIEKLARVNEVRFADAITAGLPKHSSPAFDVAIVYERTIDVAAERERLTKDIAKLEKNITNSERQLGNQSFLENAPAHIVEGLRKQDAENRLLLKKAREALDGLPPA